MSTSPRKFDGKVFKYVGFQYGKKAANEWADEERNKGKKARVVGPIKTKHGNAYSIYARK
jgi:hypothetical protein